jgi:hypothetical protein
MKIMENEIWIHTHKNELIYDLKNMISDLEDEHYSSYAFFDCVINKVEKWKQLMKMDEENAIHGNELKQLTQSMLDAQDKELLEKTKEAEFFQAELDAAAKLKDCYADCPHIGMRCCDMPCILCKHVKIKEKNEKLGRQNLQKWEKLWNKFKKNIVPFQCFTCAFSDFLPTREYLDLEHPDPKVYPICDFECGKEGHPLYQLKWTYRIGLKKCKSWIQDTYNSSKEREKQTFGEIKEKGSI